MANPNIVNVSAIYGNSAHIALTNTSATQLTSNASGSGKVYKINQIIATNVNGSSAANITINIYPAASMGGTPVALASVISVPANANLIILDKQASFYLLENQSIGATAGSSNDLTIHCSWEEIN